MNPDEVIAEFGKGVALWTDMRQQLIDSGWSPEHAEEIVIYAIKQAGS
jgi:hypothetical protein